MKIQIDIDAELQADGNLVVFVNDEVVAEYSRDDVIKNMAEAMRFQDWLSVSDIEAFGGELIQTAKRLRDE